MRCRFHVLSVAVFGAIGLLVPTLADKGAGLAVESSTTGAAKTRHLNGVQSRTETRLIDSSVVLAAAGDTSSSVRGPSLPTFDIVRLEPSGAGVMAGRAAPGSQLEIRNNTGGPLKVRADRAGEWVLILDKGLPPGEHLFSVTAVLENSTQVLKGAQTIKVRVSADNEMIPYVALIQAGRPDKVLQQPGAPVAVEEAAENTEPPEGTQVTGKSTEKAASAGEKKKADTKTKPARYVVASGSDQKDTEGKVPSKERATGEVKQKIAAVKSPVEKSQTAAAKTVVGNKKMPAKKAMSVEVMTKAVAQPAVEAPKKVTGDKPAVMIVARKAKTSKKSPPSQDIIFEVMEYRDAGLDRGEIIVKGRAGPKAHLKVFLDKSVLGQVFADGKGAWSFRSKYVVKVGTHWLRVEQLDKTGKIIAKAQAPFDRKPSTVTAAKPAEKKPEQKPVQALENNQKKSVWNRLTGMFSVGGGKTTGVRPVSFDTAVYEPKDKKTGTVRLSGQAAPGARMRLYIDGGRIGNTSADEKGLWIFTREFTLAAGLHKFKAEHVGEKDAALAEAEIPYIWKPSAKPGIAVAAAPKAKSPASGGKAAKKMTGKKIAVMRTSPGKKTAKKAAMKKRKSVKRLVSLRDKQKTARRLSPRRLSRTRLANTAKVAGPVRRKGRVVRSGQRPGARVPQASGATIRRIISVRGARGGKGAGRRPHALRSLSGRRYGARHLRRR